jgi:Uma2 family endonuclease
MVEYTHSETLSTVLETEVEYLPTKIWTFEEYINAEVFSEERNEFRNGKIIEKESATIFHSSIGVNIGTAIVNALDNLNDEDTHVFGCSMNLYISATNESIYPDLSVVKGDVIMKHEHVMTNPFLLAEILSDSTEAYDRGDKFDSYKSLPSFREYVLVSQKEPFVEVFYLENPSENVWKKSESIGLDALIELKSIGCTLKMSDIYRRVFK